MSRTFVCLILGLALSATAAHATRGSRNHPKVLTYTHGVNELPAATQDSLSWYDVLICMDRPTTIESLRAKNPGQRYLWPIQPQYADPPEGDDPWWMPDTLWSIKRLMTVYAWKNDWYLRNVDGSIVTDGTFYLINWTQYCPVGTFGSAKGLRAAEWLASVALPTIALSERYWDPWTWESNTSYNGYMFEILADCLGSYYWQNYQYADPDRDGDADGVYSACSTGGADDPLSVLFRAENEVFYQRLQAAFPPRFVFTINGNWDFIGPWWLTRLSGIKMENWMHHSNPDWHDWWDRFYGLTPPWENGQNHGGGYLWVEQHMDKPVADSLRGWDLSFLQVLKDGNLTEEQNLQEMRWGLGTAMLGDGYLCYTRDQRMPLWRPEFDWDFGEPSGDFFRQTVGADTLMVRRYEKGMVEVNPHAYAVGGVPGRDTRFTFWSGVDDLSAMAVGQTRAHVTWTSPLGNPDAPESFELRYAQAPITLQNWEQATSYAGNPIPPDPGEAIAVDIDGLAPAMTYFIAVRGRYHGLLETQLSNPVNVTTDPAEDDLPPAAIDDLASPGSGQTWIDLTWTATGDDGETGQAELQFLRYLVGETIDSEGDWNRSVQAGGVPPPSPPGSEESFRLEGLAPGTSYGIAVRVRDDRGNLSPLAAPFTASTLVPPPPPDTTPPAAITDLAGEPDEPGAVRLTWTAPGDDGMNGRAETYEVRIRLGQAIATESEWTAADEAPGDPPPPGTAGSSEAFLLAGLAEAASYGVAVRARDDAGNLAGLSNPLVIETGTDDPPPPPPDGEPPSAIDDLYALDLSDTSATLFWTAPGDDGTEGTASEYEMGWRIGGTIDDNDAWAAATKIVGSPLPNPESAGTLQSFAWNGLEPDTIYGVVLRARDDAGLLGPLGASIEVRTTVTLPPDDDPPVDTLPPDPVADLRLVRAETHEVLLHWSAPADSGADGRADAYAMRRVPEGADPDRLWDEGTEVDGLPAPSAPGATDSVAIASLESDRLYGFLLRSRDAAGNLSADSNVLWARTLSEPPPPPPPPPMPPAAIEDLTLVSSGPDSARFTWTAPGDDGHEGRARRTLIRLRAGGAIDSEEGWEAAAPADTSGLGVPPAGGETQVWTLRGLEPETLYGLAVRAEDDSALVGGLSNPLTWTTPARALEPPGPVRDLACDAQEELRARVLWRPPLPGEVLAPATAFVLARRLGSALFETEEDWEGSVLEEGSLPIPGAPEDTLSYWIEELASATTYAVTLRARDEQGRLGTLIPGIVLTTAEPDTVIDPPPPPDRPPASIGDLRVVGTGSDRALLAWTAVGEDSLTGTAAAYEMRFREGAAIETPGEWEASSPYDGVLPSPRAAGSPESLQVVGLAPASSYGFALRVRDHAGQISPFAAGVLATTEAPPAELPLPVADLTAVAVGSGTIELRWSHSRDANTERGPARYLVGRATIPLVEVLWSVVDLHPEPPDPVAAGVTVELSWIGLEPATRYWVAVRAQDGEGRLSPLSNVVAVETRPLDLAPPEPPAHVWIAGTEPDGRMRLAWEASTSPDVAGYHVYGRTGGEAWERLTVEPLLPAITRWSAPPEHRAFAVSALDLEGNESAPRTSEEGALTKIEVRGPFPHPVRASCRFEIRVPVDRLAERVRARIFDIEGEEIRLLLDEPAGRPLIDLPWDRRDSEGALAAPGFYLLRVEVGSSATHRRIYLDP